MTGEKDTIHEDVSQQQDEGAQVLSPREQAMREIDEQLAAQKPDAFVQQQPAAEQPAPSTDTQEPEVLPEDRLDKLRVRVKVDGQVMELPLSEVTKGYQKDAVASRRLAQAAEERKALEAKHREIEELGRTLAAAKASPSAGAEAGDADVDAQIAAAMTALVEGDEQGAAQALKAIILKGRGSSDAPATPVIDEEALLAKAEARIEQKREAAERARAWDEFVASNPAFADETSKQRQYGDYLFVSVFAPRIEAGEISYREALSEAAKEVSAVFGAGAAEQQGPSARQQKEERKKAIDNLPTATARAVRPVPEAETTDDVLAEMRKMRGQPV